MSPIIDPSCLIYPNKAANLSGSVTSLLIAQGAHHLDLMFSRPEDPPSVVRVFVTERVNGWISVYSLYMQK
jgi:hypothetical protein